MYLVPLMVLGVDGLKTDSVYHRHLTRSRFWVDFLAMLAGVSIAISSSITLLVSSMRVLSRVTLLMQIF
jgi:hypothetical protein